MVVECWNWTLNAEPENYMCWPTFINAVCNKVGDHVIYKGISSASSFIFFSDFRSAWKNIKKSLQFEGLYSQCWFLISFFFAYYLRAKDIIILLCLRAKKFIGKTNLCRHPQHQLVTFPLLRTLPGLPSIARQLLCRVVFWAFYQLGFWGAF